MIDSFTVDGVLSAYSKSRDGHAEPARVEFLRALGEKWIGREVKIQSPFTGAPIGMVINQTSGGLTDPLTVRFKVPVASAFVGHSCLHGWTECLDMEKAVTSRLLRQILVQQGLTNKEASGFILSAQVTSFKLVWHVGVKGRHAARALLKRAIDQVKVLHAHNDWPNIGVEGYALTNEPAECSLEIALKFGNRIKISIQPETLSVGPELHRSSGINAEVVRAVTKNHVRVEVIVGQRLIEDWGIGNPGSWSAFGMESCVDTVLHQSGFMTPYRHNPADFSAASLAKDVRGILELYLHDQSMSDMNMGTVRRLRDVLIEKGVDIAIRPLEHRSLDGSIGKQLHYSNRWKVPDGLRGLMLSEVTLPTISARFVN